MADLGRRKFLVGCCQGAAALVTPVTFKGVVPGAFVGAQAQSAASREIDYHLHPQYREQRPIDSLLLKADAELDDYVSEKHHDGVARILDGWCRSLVESSAQVQGIASVLGARFRGASLKPIEAKVIRRGGGIEVERLHFGGGAQLEAEGFLDELRTSLKGFSQITKADFQVTAIAVERDGGLRTQVRYEFAGTGSGFYREQRVGVWALAWEIGHEGEYRVTRFEQQEESRSRTTAPIYADITQQAIGGNSSYGAQIVHGADYWRTVLDGACGIDIYGHNGVSVGDMDGDGFDDLYVCQPAGLPNRLYRNRRDGTFEDVTERSGLGLLDNTACAIFADFTNSGRQDLVVVRAAGPVLFLNEGGGRFRAKPDAFAFANTPQGTFTGAAAADYNRDGWLDLYFCLYVFYQGTDQYKYPTPYYDARNGPPNFLMRNNGDGTFRDATAEAGLNENNTRYSFCCGWNDFNGDGWPDLYVVNDFGRKNLYRNKGDGTFSDVAGEVGAEDVGAGMSICAFDYNNDGAEDFYVGDMWTAAGVRISAQERFQEKAPAEARALYRKHAMGNSLFENREHRFRDATTAAGVAMGRWAWSSDAWDFDHDGLPDLYVANGMISGTLREDLNSFFWRQVVAHSPNTAQPASAYEQGWNAINELVRADYSWSGYERNVFYANNRDGTFSDISSVAGLDFEEDGRAFSLADFDGDGRQEVVLKNRNGPQLRVLENVMEALPPSIAFRLRGLKSNRDAIGAAITIQTEAGRTTRRLQAGSGFLSQHSKEVLFGLGEAKGEVTALIRWPSGLEQRIEGLPPNHRIWVDEGAKPSRLEPFSRRRSRAAASVSASTGELLLTRVETWLLEPVPAPGFSLLDGQGRTRTLLEQRGHATLVSFWTATSPGCLAQRKAFASFRDKEDWRLIAVNVDEKFESRDAASSFVDLHGSADVTAVYNILYRMLFDRHRDLSLPSSFLIDERGDVVKIYQGQVDAARVREDIRRIPRTKTERLEMSLPFRGNAETFEFGRNYLSSGSVYFQRGYYEQAEEVFRIALRENPSSAEALYGVGSACLKLKKTAEAKESFRRAVQQTGSYPETLPNAWNNLGLIEIGEHRMEEAIAAFEHAVSLNPDHLIALKNLGNAYRQQKRLDEAEKVFARALHVMPDDAEAAYGLGMTFAQEDDVDRAYENLQLALKNRPGYPEALNNLGVLFLRTRRRDEAVAKFEECITVAPDFEQAYLNLARVYMIEGTGEKARAVMLRLQKRHPESAQAQQLLEQVK